MSEDSGNTKSLLLALIPAAIFLLALLLAKDPQIHREVDISGVIIGNVQQVTETKNPDEYVQVRLANGEVVNAIIAPVSGFPYKIGTPVLVTPYRSMVFGKRTYRALAESR